MNDPKPIVVLSIYEPANAELMNSVLRNYKVINALNADEAIPHIEKEKPFVVISDVTNGGYKLYDYVTKHSPTTKIIFVDGGLLEREKVQGTVILDKPLDIFGLAGIVEQNLPEHLKRPDVA